MSTFSNRVFPIQRTDYSSRWSQSRFYVWTKKSEGLSVENRYEVDEQ